MNKMLWFDMDGTFVDLYTYPSWLEHLEKESALPYMLAKPLVNMAQFAKLLNKVQRNGYTIGIISWGSKFASDEYMTRIADAKRKWISKHMPSVTWDKIEIVKYGTPKHEVCKVGCLFDDEVKNLEPWDCGQAVPAEQMINFLKTLT